MPTPLGSAKSRYASNESTLTPLEIKSRLFLTTYGRFDSTSHHVLHDKQPPKKKMHCRFHLYLFQVPLSSDGGIVCDHITFDAPAKQTTNSLPHQH